MGSQAFSWGEQDAAGSKVTLATLPAKAGKHTGCLKAPYARPQQVAEMAKQAPGSRSALYALRRL